MLYVVVIVPPKDAFNKFAGNGVLFKAKLFGTAEVNQPRGRSQY